MKPVEARLPAEVVTLIRLYHRDEIPENELLERLEPWIKSSRSYLQISPARGVEPDERLAG